jgi:hypothetical protein
MFQIKGKKFGFENRSWAFSLLYFWWYVYIYKDVNVKCGGVAMYLGVFDMGERLEQMRKLLKEKRRLKELLEQDIQQIERDIDKLEKQLERAERSLSLR